MIDNSFPRLGQDAGSYAAIQEIRLLLALGCKVTFLPHNLLHLGIHVEYLQKMGVECVHAPFHRSVPKFLERRASEFDAIYVTRYVVAENIVDAVREHSNAKIIFNNADLHFLRELRTAIQAGQSDLSSVATTRRRELAVMQSVDAVLSYNDIELEIISSHLLNREKLFRCPWVLHPASGTANRAPRRDISFLGGFAHPPNKAAIDWFLHYVMPELNRRRPEVTLHIWGSHLPESSDWGNVPGVVVEGYADTLDDVFSDTLVFIAPLQTGAGIKGKVLDSVAYGVPTVLSPIAAEATGLIDGSSTLIAHTPEQWVSHIESLLDDDVLWAQIRENSVSICNRLYSMDAGIDAMQKVFDFLNLDTDVVYPQVAA
jgi:glycosyltransferase involved in cell wall biosynthesis